MKKFRKLNFVFVLVLILFSFGLFFRVDAADTFTKEVDFNLIGSNPTGFLVKASDGMLYGMTSGGGKNAAGVIFQYNPTTNTYTKKYDFETVTGDSPFGSLVEGDDGLLYGMTDLGGANNKGVIFQYNPTTNTYTKKYDLNINNGMMPPSNSRSLFKSSNGMFYGMTEVGGTSNSGTIFEYDPVNNIYTKKYDFTSTPDGVQPRGSFIQASNGMLYGVTENGGTNNSGTIFEYDPVNDIYTKKHDFESNLDGSKPYGSLVKGSDNMLYGTTPSGGANGHGTIFQYDPATSTYTKKYDFGVSPDGYTSYGSLIKASDDMLYGMTYAGGANGRGTIFQYDPATNTYVKKYNFGVSPDGKSPKGALFEFSDGVLYGLTESGGSSDYFGTIFQYDIATSTYTKKYDFIDALYGSGPRGSLIKASDGIFYGTAYNGGSRNNCGTIFQYNSATGVISNKYNFSSSFGCHPADYLAEGSDGKLYGMAHDGGANSYGVIFQYDPSTNVYTKLHDFVGGEDDGAYPYGSLIKDADGIFYGMTYDGGAGSYGTIFQYDSGTSTYTKLYDFDDTNGSNPYGLLIKTSNGEFLGVTYGGGLDGYGVIFKYNPTINIYTKLHDFSDSGNDGTSPRGSLIEGALGKFYGMTYDGGTGSYGTIFQYDSGTSTYTKLYDFDGTNGSHPYGSLIKTSNGELRGMTYDGGANSKGVIFQYNPSTNVYTKLHDFAGGEDDGANPYGSLTDGSDGFSYGLTYGGGIDGAGTIFKWGSEIVVVPTPTPTPTLVRSHTHSSGTTIETIAKFKQAQLQSSMNASTGTSTTTGSGWTHRTLKLKMTGDDVKTLQVYLNGHNYLLASTGVGSLGNETTYFGKLTKQAVIKFQLANSLVGDGIVGPKTWAKIDSIK